MPRYQNDISILRELAREKAQIAALEVQEEKRQMWRALNALHPVRPMVTISQMPWHELEAGEELLTLKCADPFLRGIEQEMRRELYQWTHFPADMVIEPYIRVAPAVNGNSLVATNEDISVTDAANNIVGHAYHDVFENEADIDSKISMPKLTIDTAENNRRFAMAQEAVGGILGVKSAGVDVSLAIWDRIVERHGVENSLIDVLDRPEFMHHMVSRFVDYYSALTDELERLGLFDETRSYVHCSGCYTDELPKDGYAEGHPRARDTWVYGMAQIFASASPAVHDEFEIEPLRALFERYGLVYYGCCEPLHDRIGLIRKIKNVRKISVSPWADADRAADEIHGDYVLSNKPTPALLAADSLDTGAVRAHISHVMDVCSRTDTPCEFLLKDISTVCYHPKNLADWEKTVMGMVQG